MTRPSLEKESLVDWLFANPEKRLYDFAQAFGVSERDMWELRQDGDLKARLVARYREQEGENPNPPCPQCGGDSARISYGYPLPPEQMLVRDWLRMLAGEITSSHGCVVYFDIVWHCNDCGHEWGGDGDDE